MVPCPATLTETKETPVVGETPAGLLKSLARISGAIRAWGAGAQADQLDEIGDKLTRAFKPPRLHGVLAQLAHPLAWPTREHGLWMAERLQAAGELLELLRADAEITGSDAVISRLDEWLESLGLRRSP